MKCHPVLAGVAIATSAISLAAAPEVEAPVPLAVESAIASDDDNDVAGMVYSEKELDDLLAPLALYPDPLVALILPASTSPSDIVLASRYLAANPKATAFDDQPWDDAVRSLARYPEVVKWMDENLSWTKALGDAFANQPVDVMNAIQRLRAKAQASGALATTSQQTVVAEGEEIRIVPTEPEVIYIPRYDPAVVYVERPYSYYYGPLITFSVGFPLGYWAAYDFDWRYRRIYVIHREHRVRVWNECREYRRPLYVTRADHRHTADWAVWRAKYSHTPSSTRGTPHFGGRAVTGRDYSTRRPSVSTAALHGTTTSTTAASPGVDRVRSADQPRENRYRSPRDHADATRDWRQHQPPAATTDRANNDGTRRVIRGPQIPQPGDPNFSGPVATRDRQRAEQGSTYRRSLPPDSSRNSTPAPSASVPTDRSTRSTTDVRSRPNVQRSDNPRHFSPPPRSSTAPAASAPSVRSAPPVSSSPPPTTTVRSPGTERPSYQPRSESSQSSYRRSESSAWQGRSGAGRSNRE